MDEPVQSPEAQPSNDDLPNETPAAVVKTPDVKPRWLPDLPKSTRYLHLLAGFAGWFLINGLIWQTPDLWLILFPANLLAPVILSTIHRRWIAMGVLLAWAANLLLSLIAGAVFNAACLIPFFIDI